MSASRATMDHGRTRSRNGHTQSRSCPMRPVRARAGVAIIKQVWHREDEQSKRIWQSISFRGNGGRERRGVHRAECYFNFSRTAWQLWLFLNVRFLSSFLLDDGLSLGPAQTTPTHLITHTWPFRLALACLLVNTYGTARGSEVAQ